MALATLLRDPAILVAAWLAAAGPAAAATIYGSLTQGGQPLANAALELRCGNERPLPGTTDTRGSYRFTVGATGNCELLVQGALARVVVYPEPTRYDFDLRKGKEGLELARR